MSNNLYIVFYNYYLMNFLLINSKLVLLYINYYKQSLNITLKVKPLIYNYMSSNNFGSNVFQKKLISYKKQVILSISKNLTYKSTSLNYYPCLVKFIINIGFFNYKLYFLGNKFMNEEIYLFNLFNLSLYSSVKNSLPLKYILTSESFDKFSLNPHYCFLLDPKVSNLRSIIYFKNKLIPILGLSNTVESSEVYDKTFLVTDYSKATIFKFFVITINLYLLGLSYNKKYLFNIYIKQLVFLYFYYLKNLQIINVLL
jgi:hypothetical protein